ncbi:RDD family protein [Microvirga subterranea]|uniref:Putative RDD family membrane protein YckC n=1 Tax=Microvirga subterranea TaxID=186651 RepID=A0A370HMU9_9HYPH|nr:RDD family protein [Microvirga subterranea]RDI59848.1 putative RDD family membrane protein YckC [Microvirga subterranea]
MVNRSSLPPMSYQPYHVDARLTEGVISRRFWAYLIDLCVVAVWIVLICIAIFIFGLLTLGLGWGLFVVLPLTAFTFVLYNAVTIGGSSQATVGMRMMGLRVVDPSGRPVGMLAAGVHALLFYVAVSTFLLWACDVLIGFFRDDRRFVRDLLTNMMVIRA